MNNDQLIYHILTFIPLGKVLTYQKLANLANLNNPRLIGSFLHKNKDPNKYPCHRVVSASGKVASNYAFGGAVRQKEKLLNEGVQFVGENVDMSISLWQPSRPLEIYFDLLQRFGHPGPWPWFDQGDPHTLEEIAIGAILTQNTNWKNVQKSLDILNECSCATLESLSHCSIDQIKVMIKSSGFFNQKANYLKNFIDYILKSHGSFQSFLNCQKDEQIMRNELLSIKGIGRETADTVLLYCANKPIFVIDAYTKKLTQNFELSKNLDYDLLQNYFIKNLPKNVDLYQDFHALIVRWAQNTELDLKN